MHQPLAGSSFLNPARSSPVGIASRGKMNTVNAGGPRGGRLLVEQSVSTGAPAQTCAGQFSPSTFAVLRTLEKLANPRSTCSPSMRDLSHATGFSQNSIRKALEKLKRAGRLTITPQFGEDGGRNANRYTLQLASGKHA